MNLITLAEVTQQVTETPKADFTIGVCMGLAALIIVCLFADDTPRRGRGVSPKTSPRIQLDDDGNPKPIRNPSEYSK